MGTEVQDDGMATDANGSATGQADGTITNFADIGKARNSVLEVRLDAAAQGTDSVSGTSTSIDPQGYLTSLNKSELEAGELSVGNIKRARTLLESVIKRNPRHGPGWIAAARLEELAGKVQAAQNVIRRGTEMCPKSESVWVEAIRLSARHGNKHNAKVLAAKALENNDRSVDLWLEAVNLEDQVVAKKRVLRKALDHAPQSVTLWKEAVNLEENRDDAKLMLAKATEIIPQSVELWLALARLETPEQAQVVLNKARKCVPTSYEIWVAAARLQEQAGNHALVFKVIERGTKALAKESAMLKRENWIAQAEKCEEEGAVVTCQAIIRETVGWGLDEDDGRKQIWIDDAKASTHRGKFETARAIYNKATQVFYNRKSAWLAAADLERQHGTKEALWNLLERSIEACPNAEILWMELAREKWQAGEHAEAKKVLAKAFSQNPGNEDIWLAAVNLEADDGKIEKARGLLASARAEAGTNRVWYKSVAFERRIKKDSDEALALANEALQHYPKEPKLWMMKGQIYEDKKMVPQAREAYNTGTRVCPQSVPLWILAAKLEENQGVLVKARSILDRARLAVKNSPELWVESVRLELRAKNTTAAQQKLAQALQACPTSGLIWSERIWHLESRTQRKPRILEAIQKTDNDPLLFVTAARIFWGERKLDKADTWFQKAAIADPDHGDTWAWWYRFALQHGTEEKRAELIKKCVANQPKHGEVWQSVAKQPENAALGTEAILKIVMKKLK
jgi:pre-mRNA-processing factor 6